MEPGLEAFIASVENDPLFAAEGMDLERGETILTAIENCAREIEEVSSQESFALRLFLIRYPITKHALPISFVQACIDAERNRRACLANPSQYTAEELLKSWDLAASMFARAVIRYKNLHTIVRRLDPEAGASAVDMHGNITTYVDVDRTLVCLETNATQLQEEVRERRALLRGELVLKNSDHREEHSLMPFTRGEALSKYRTLHELELLHSLPFRTSDVEESYGPLAYTMHQFDGKPTRHHFMVYIVHNRERNLKSLKIVALDVHTFLKLGKTARTASAGALHTALVDLQIPYWYQPSTNLYTMRDQTYWADIATIVDYVRRPSLSALVAKQRSSLFDLLLGSCLEDHKMHLSNTKELIRTSGSMPKKYYSLLFRTHPSIYFMPFNKSVWRVPEEPNFLGSGRSSPEERLYVSADTVLEDTLPEEFELIMQSGRIREEARRAAGE